MYYNQIQNYDSEFLMLIENYFIPSKIIFEYGICCL